MQGCSFERKHTKKIRTNNKTEKFFVFDQSKKKTKQQKF